MLPRVFKALLVGGSEILLAVVLVLSFTLVFLGILVFSFPRGTGLISVYDALVEPEGDGARVDWSGRGEDAFLARLSHVKRRVRERPATAVAWTNAREGMDIEDRHTIQTLARSGATIAFAGDSSLELGENSLVVIRHPGRREHRRTRHASLVVLGGAVRGRIALPADQESPLEIVTASASAMIEQQGDLPAEFRVVAHADESATVAVFSGSAEITSGGRTTVVLPNQAITVDPSRPLGDPVDIPDRPGLISPTEDLTKPFASVTPQIRFDWTVAGDADAFRLAIARDAEFDDVVFEEIVAESGFVHGSLAAGRYHWRVSALVRGAEGAPSRPGSFRIVQDLQPPELRVDWPRGVVRAERMVLRGATEPGAELIVGDRRVPVAPNGDFEWSVDLEPGMNMIVVEAVDAAGNSNYRSQYVNAKF